MKPPTITIRVMCPKFRAAKLGTDRGIPMVFLQESPHQFWSLFRVSRDYLPELNRWFAEATDPRAYPVNP